MGKKTTRLCSRHRWIPVLVMALIWSLLLLTELEGWSWWILIPMTLCMLLSLLFGSAATLSLVTDAAKILQNQCDPYPLLEETTYQLSYVKNRGDRTLLTIDRSAGLVEAGYYQQALEELEELDIHEPARTAGVRYAYYHNLALAAFSCNQKEKAEVYYQNAIQQANTLKGKAREQAAFSRAYLSATVCRMHGNYNQAYQLLAPLSSDNLQGQVSRAYVLAEIAVAQGQPDIARVHVDFVLRYGNRMHLVTKAQNLLEEQDEKTPS